VIASKWDRVIVAALVVYVASMAGLIGLSEGAKVEESTNQSETVTP
jgi:hypothetical protein